MPTIVLLWLSIASALVACSVSPDYTNTTFACSDDRCPGGYRCDRKIAACVLDTTEDCGGPAAIATSFESAPAWLALDNGVTVAGGKLVFMVPAGGGVGASSRRPFQTFDLTRGELIIRGVSPPSLGTDVYLNLWSQGVSRGMRLSEASGATKLVLFDENDVAISVVADVTPGPVDIRVRGSDGMLEIFYATASQTWQPLVRRDETAFSLAFVNLEIYAASSGVSSVVTIDEITSDRDARACKVSQGFADDFLQPLLDEQWAVAASGRPCSATIADGVVELRTAPGDECEVGLRRLVDLREATVGMFRSVSVGPYILRVDVVSGTERIATLVKASTNGTTLSASNCSGSMTCVDRFVSDLGEPWLGLVFSPVGNGMTTVSFVAGSGPGATSRAIATLTVPTDVALAQVAISFRGEAPNAVGRIDTFTTSVP